MGSKVRFAARAVVEEDPKKFAIALEDTMNGLVEEGWQVTSMVDRGEAVIVNAQRQMEIPCEPALPSSVGELVERAGKNTVTEIVYSYLDEGIHRNIRFQTMPAVISKIREHLKDQRFLPNQIVVMSVTSFEPIRDLQELIRTFPDPADA
jgi:hypothetical protein